MDAQSAIRRSSLLRPILQVPVTTLAKISANRYFLHYCNQITRLSRPAFPAPIARIPPPSRYNPGRNREQKMIEPIRNSDPTLLHPVFREKASRLLIQLAGERIPFRLFEGFRSPQRQQYLYSQGRTRPGAIVTRARPWTSYHQYGLAGDFVLVENGQWSWDISGPKAAWWRRLSAVGKTLGLEPLSFEMPHLQLAGLKIKDLAGGQYPAGGDATWQAALDADLASKLAA
jgi:D-alanyl-D-alanine carboxypeptidase